MRRRLALLGTVALAGACGGPRPPPPTTVAGRIAAVAEANPDAEGRPSPVVLRLYELRSPGRFQAADYFDLAQRDKEQATLGPDLKAREEWLLPPGGSVPLERTLDPETRAIGVVAGYRELGGAVWRAVAPVSPGKAHAATVSVGRNAVTLELTPR